MRTNQGQLDNLATTVSLLDSQVHGDANGVETFPRRYAINTPFLTMNSAYLTTFVAGRAAPTISKLAFFVGATAATGASGITKAELGLYEVAANGVLTRVARTVSDVGLFAAADAYTERALEAPYVMVPGQRYGMAIGVWGSGAVPNVRSVISSGQIGARVPQLTAHLTGVAELQAADTLRNPIGANVWMGGVA